MVFRSSCLERPLCGSHRQLNSQQRLTASAARRTVAATPSNTDDSPLSFDRRIDEPPVSPASAIRGADLAEDGVVPV